MEGNLSEYYDFDAPMFVDFTNTEQLTDPEADKWFDDRDDGVIEMDSLEEDEPSRSEVEEETTTTEPKPEPSEVETATLPEEETVKNDNGNTNEQAQAKEEDDNVPFMFLKKIEPKNIVTSFATCPWKPRINASAPVENEPPLKKQKQTKTNTSRSLNSSGSKQSEPQAKRQKSMNDSKGKGLAPLTRAQHKAANARRRSLRISRKRTISTSSTGIPSDVNRGVSRSMSKASKKPMPKTKAPMLTIPTTPTLLKRPKAKPTLSAKPREELEIEAIEKMRQELKDKRKHNEEFMKKALAAGAYTPYRSAEDNLTQAVEFHFETDKRIKAPQPQTSTDNKEKSFFETLRQHPASPSHKNRTLTVPQPFNFHGNQSKKRKMTDEEDSSCEGYVSMAQQCYKFQTKTPPRFHTKNTKEGNSGPPASEVNKSSTKLTCPKTPNLSSVSRKRPLPEDCLSREQQEEKEAEEMRNYKFKAREFDPRIVEKQGTYGLKPLQPKNLTEVKPFALTSEQRSEIYKQKEKESHVEEKPVIFKAQPVPEFEKIEFKPELQHQTTKQKPFSFEERNKQMQAKKEQKIQNVLEEEKKAREFRAQPLQSFSPMKLISNSKSLTKFEPFNLETENRGAQKAEQWIKKVQEDLQEERKKVVFKAHSSNVLYQAPFVPKKSLKPSTTFEEFDLNSERRAKERAVYEMNKKEKEMANLELQHQRELEREEEEKRNIAILRKQLVHKSNPIRSYKQVEIHPSNKPLTLPESPAWNTREKKNMRV